MWYFFRVFQGSSKLAYGRMVGKKKNVSGRHTDRSGVFKIFLGVELINDKFHSLGICP